MTGEQAQRQIIRMSVRDGRLPQHHHHLLRGHHRCVPSVFRSLLNGFRPQAGIGIGGRPGREPGKTFELLGQRLRPLTTESQNRRLLLPIGGERFECRAGD